MADPFYTNASSIVSYLNSSGLQSANFNSGAFSNWLETDFGSFSTSPNIPDFGGDLLATPFQNGGGDAWTFITAPGTVSWTVSSDVQRLDIFGTNAPPVVVSSKGMRDLTLSEALVEGFTLGRSVQPHIERLENLMNVTINTSEGFVGVPVYKVFAGPMGGGKDYGFYVIEQIQIEEQLRDLKGNATRAMVGINLKQVPEYQVGTGIDQAGASTGGQVMDPSKFTNQAEGQDAKVKGKKGSTKAGASGAAADAAGAAGGGGAGGGGQGALATRWRQRYAAEAGREAKF